MFSLVYSTYAVGGTSRANIDPVRLEKKLAWAEMFYNPAWWYGSIFDRADEFVHLQCLLLVNIYTYICRGGYQNISRSIFFIGESFFPWLLPNLFWIQGGVSFVISRDSHFWQSPLKWECFAVYPNIMPQYFGKDKVSGKQVAFHVIFFLLLGNRFRQRVQ